MYLPKQIVLGGLQASTMLNTPVRIESGLVSGIQSEHSSLVTEFKGIPFAGDVSGVNRWKPARPALSWEGVRVADAFGSKCPQHGEADEREDCLNLNIWTPAETSHEALPVYVWIYGGRFTGGSGSDSRYWGGGLAEKGVVVVTFNYRLGVFGFLSTPELSAESDHEASGNYGSLDQIAALEWIQRNIGAFGGDPAKVTIGGQSAGAASVYQLVNSPLAKGLFRGAIAQSGIREPGDPAIAGIATSYRTLPQAEQQGLDYQELCDVSSIADMRQLSVKALLANNNMNDPDYRGNSMAPPFFRPVLDGYVMTRTYRETLDGGYFNDVALMTGNTKDESGASPSQHVSLDEYQSSSAKSFGNMTEEFLELYPASDTETASDMTNEAARDSSRVGTWLFANQWSQIAQSPVYHYFWTHAPPGSRAGASHMSEITYTFDNLRANNGTAWAREDYSIADTMSTYWANFVKTLNPNGAGKDSLVYWPESSRKSRMTFEIGSIQRLVSIAADEARTGFFERFYAAQKQW